MKHKSTHLNSPNLGPGRALWAIEELTAEKIFSLSQVIRDCLTKGIEDASEGDDPLADVIYVHDDLYDSGNEGIDDKLWS